MKIKLLIPQLFLFILFLIAPSQLSFIHCQIPVGSWRDHLSWNTADAVAVAGNKVYCSNGVGVCIYDIASRNMDKLTKVNGLSDAGVSALQYAASVKAIVLGYANGNVDVLSGNDIYNIPDIKRNSIYANKRINHIYISGESAYLSCSFGIVVVDLKLRQVRDTYIIGDSGSPVEVFALTEFEGFFYAATTIGIKKADSNSRVLTDFASWKKVEDIPDAGHVFTQIVSSDKYLYICDLSNKITTYDGQSWKNLPLPFAVQDIHRLTISGGRLLVSTSSAIFIYETDRNLLQNTIKSYNGTPVDAHDATLGSDGSYWIADNRQGLVYYSSANAVSYHLLNGPSSNNAAAFRFKSDRLLVASGGRGADDKSLNIQGEIHTFSGNQWSSIRPEGLYDFTDVDISTDASDRYYVSSWGGGVYVFENGTLAGHYTQNNSTLLADNTSVYCGGLLMDENHKLWISNNQHASVFYNNQWKLAPWQSGAAMGRYTQDNYGQIWTTRSNNGLWVFDKAAVEQGQTGRTIGFAPYNYTQTTPIYRNNQIANTPDGIIWVGTYQGPVYYNNPAKIIDGEGTKGYHPNRTGTDEPSYLYALLGSENVLSVAIDGAYRKWFGTETGGVFLIAEDNVSEVQHFTVDNSPLFSNKIHNIAINDKTGEVYFATDYGIVAYRGDAVASGDNFGNVYVFPNPVRPDYQGEITITGLIKDADVKITDVAGNLVYQTRTLGGQAVWNGCNQKGRRVATGVYLVFCTNDDGSKTHITKLLFIR